MSFLYFHWLFPLSARETSPGNRSIYKSTRERGDSPRACMGDAGSISWVPVRTQFFCLVNGPKLFKRKVFEFGLSGSIKNG